MPEDNTSDATQNTEPSAHNDAQANDTTPRQGGTADEQPKTFTQEDLDRLLAKTRREEKAKYEKELANAKKTELERAQAELAEMKAWRAERETKDEVISYLRDKGKCTRPEAAYLLIKSSIQRDKEGKPDNLRDLLAEVKSLAPEFFPDEKKPPGSADGGKQGEAQTATSMNDLIRRAAGRQV